MAQGADKKSGGKSRSRPSRKRDSASARGEPDAREPDASDSERMRVVGIGASAGGLEALEAFFTHLPADTDMAFVVLTHQHAGAVSLMADLLARKTKMRVIELSAEPTPVAANCVYTVHPGSVLSIERGVLRSTSDANASAHPIDAFFQALAEDQGPRAVGVILSGTGSDGTAGVRAIKAREGYVLVQSPESAHYDGMPRSALDAGVVDDMATPDALPHKLVAFSRGGGSMPDSPARAARTASAPAGPLPDAAWMQRLFDTIRVHTGRDFSQYKPSTVGRRLERHMRTLRISDLDAYLDHLKANPAELDVLARELLIGVTSFFRDASAWDALRAAFTEHLADKPVGYQVRAWVPGCSTGEEAYTLAMMLREVMDQLAKSVDVHIFATDLDDTAISTARLGLYPMSAAEDLTPDRVEAYFTKEDTRLRVRREIREMLVFATQDLISDPPFTRLDALVCRNLLIYMDATLQRRLLPIMHYAVKPGGLLLLGSSESVGPYADLFATVDRKWKLFRRLPVDGQHPTTLSRPMSDSGLAPRAPALRPSNRDGKSDVRFEDSIAKMLLRDMVPPTVIVQEDGRVVHVHGRTGLFLEPAPGAQTAVNLLDMARPGLQRALSRASFEVRETRRESVQSGVDLALRGERLPVNVRVTPLSEPSLRGLLRVTFEIAREPAPAPRPAPLASSAEDDAPDGAEKRYSRLEHELWQSRESHQATVEELETANEELTSTNEELQSTNEELQSTNEELETSKEEMQSLNEELQTVNAELHAKVDELSSANNDMKNLLNGTDIATVFLDNKLQIKRFTEQAKKVIRLIPSDVGRPMADLVSNLHYSRLIDDADEVLHTLVFKEIEVSGDDGRCYLMRILPYRTTENVIDGLVITFVDISKVTALQAEQHRVVEVLRKSPVSVFGQDQELRFTWACGALFGRRLEDLRGQSDVLLFGPEGAQRLAEFKHRVLETGRPQRGHVELTMDGVTRAFELYMEPEHDLEGAISGISCVAIESNGSH